MILSLLFVFLIGISLENTIEPCDTFCCRNIKQGVTYTENDRLLHGLDCPIFCGTSKFEKHYIINQPKSFFNFVKLCWFCYGDKFSYDTECNNDCCKKEAYVVDYVTGILHIIDCKATNLINIKSCKLYKKGYNIIEGYKQNDFYSLCSFCLPQLIRIF